VHRLGLLLEPVLGDPAVEHYEPARRERVLAHRRRRLSGCRERAYEQASALSSNVLERTDFKRRLETVKAR
jgi:hypothetical protein